MGIYYLFHNHNTFFEKNRGTLAGMKFDQHHLSGISDDVLKGLHIKLCSEPPGKLSSRTHTARRHTKVQEVLNFGDELYLLKLKFHYLELFIVKPIIFSGLKITYLKRLRGNMTLIQRTGFRD